MLEPWDELLVIRKERLLCEKDVQAIKEICAREHGKAHPIECKECWKVLLNRMRDRYLLSADKEWFAGRRAFLQELDSLFAQALQHEVDIQTIEQRVMEEKKEWYRDKVRNLGLHVAAKTPADARTLQQKQNDRGIPVEQLGTELKASLKTDIDLSNEEFGAFLESLKAAQSSPQSVQAKAEAYIEILFRPGRDLAADAKSQKYIDMIKDGKPISEVINTIHRDQQSAKGGQDEKQQLQKKLEELTRAKAAHEADKAKRDEARQAKIRTTASSEAETVLGNCSVCGKGVNRERLVVCPICQVLAELYKVRSEPTFLCSEGCLEDGYQHHAKENHTCASGQGCTTLHDPDVEMDGTGGPVTIFCKECVEDLETDSIFCSPRCYDANFQDHREDVHFREREKQGIEADDEKLLVFDPDQPRTYRAKVIEEHFVTLRDALGQWEAKMGAKVLHA
ncbi:hypothetical protein F5Y18DRAFT_322711 [Xylariaceae sp. FL1019]|nr:hypothetical protein F5Y18DRAFT_322711 [Xylariaceae sp. FL1019]